MAESGAPGRQRGDCTQHGRALWDAQTRWASTARAGQPAPMTRPAHRVQGSLGRLSHWGEGQDWHVLPSGPGAHSPQLPWQRCQGI